MKELPAGHQCDPAVKLCSDCLRAWLDRPPPRRIDEREWEEFELERVQVAA